MNNTTGVLVMAAFSAIGMAVSEGVDTVRHALTGGMVSGSGVYSGDPAPPGALIMIDWSIHKKTDCPGVNSRVWNGPDGFHLVEASKPTALPQTSTPQEYTVPTRVPDTSPPGVIELTITGNYHCTGFEPHQFKLGPVLIPVIDR